MSYREFPSVGRFESAHFDPERWKPDYPNRVFDRMDADDAFWAASIVARFTDERIRAMVATGDYVGESAGAHVARSRSAATRSCAGISPVRTPSSISATKSSRSRTSASSGAWNGLRVPLPVVPLRQPRDPRALDGPRSTVSRAVPLPVDPAPYWMLRIETVSPEEHRWSRPVDVYVRNDGSMTIVGISRAAPRLDVLLDALKAPGLCSARLTKEES